MIKDNPVKTLIARLATIAFATAALLTLLMCSKAVAQDCVVSHPYLSPLDNNYYQLCWVEGAPGILYYTVTGFSPPEQCDTDGVGGDQDGDQPGCAEPGPQPNPVICDSDQTTDAPACRLPAGCNDGADGRDGAVACYCTTGNNDTLPDCPPGS